MKSFPSQTIHHTCPGRRKEAQFWCKMTNQTLQTQTDHSLYQIFSVAALSFSSTIAFYSCVKYMPPYPLFSLPFFSKDRSLMASADLDIAIRLTVDILFFKKNRSCPFIFLALLRLPGYCQTYSSGEGGRDVGWWTDNCFQSLLIV